jgi:ABC-type uncharacterized transport system ATPase subunit
MSTANLSTLCRSQSTCFNSTRLDLCKADGELDQIAVLKEQFECSHFRILIMGRANAGKTTILEKVCGVKQGTKPVVYNKDGVEIKTKPKLLSQVKGIFGKKAAPSTTYLSPSVEVSQTMKCKYLIDLQVIFREVSMILRTRSHTVEATLSSMILRGLNLVEVMRLEKFCNSLRSDALQQS